MDNPPPPPSAATPQSVSTPPSQDPSMDPATAAAGAPPAITGAFSSSMLLGQLGTNSSFAASPSHAYAVRPMEIVESIRGLHELHQQGGLTMEEFTQAKQAILDSSSSSSAGTRGDARSRRASSQSTDTHRRRRRSSRTTSKHTRSSRRHGRSSSTSSSSSSSSASDKFIVMQRPGVWRSLNPGMASDGSYTPAPEDGASPISVSLDHRRDANDEDSDASSPLLHSPLARPDEAHVSFHPPVLSARKTSSGDTTPHPHVAFANADHASADGSEHTRGHAVYGTFLKNRGKQATTTTTVGFFGDTTALPQGVSLNSPDVVKIRYFNSRGTTGDRYADVELSADEMRSPVFLYKGGVASQVAGVPGATAAMLQSQSNTHLADDEPVTIQPVLTAEERRLWEEMSSSHSTKSSLSFLEQSLNWYWIDVSGRDPSRRRYNVALKFLTRRFKICESFLVEREHSLLLPQVIESPTYPGQYLLNLRVATDKISIAADSVMELTNRWIIIVDLNQHLVITVHRVDTRSMALLRSQWKKVMSSADVSFQEFLLKIIDDAIYTYQLSLDVHEDLLDKCESKIFTADENVPVSRMPSHQERAEDLRILHHFAGSSRSPFLRNLLDQDTRTPINKNEMNGFLHHLHRRTSVQHRMLNITRDVLGVAFTKLRLCSKELADQMCSSCSELRDRALEVRDDAKTVLDLHISIQSFRTNELMAVLTRVSILFTPCTFVAGVYGMNFRKNFPELDWSYGYVFFWLVCLVTIVAMQLYFFRGKL